MEKVITAVFQEGGSNTVTVYGLWQWDHGISLQIMGLSLPETVEVHFAIGQGEPVNQEGRTTDGITTVDIPDSMLAGPTGAGIFGCMGAFLVNAWVYVEDGTSGRTVKMIKLNVKTRAKPPDYIATPEEKKTWEQLQEGKADRLAVAGSILSLMSGDRLLSEVTLPTGGGGEELADIRVGADGRIYHSAGEAVRVQVGNLKEDLDEVIDTGFEVVNSYNRVKPDTINVGKYVYNANGILMSNPAYNATDFIPIKKDHIYAFAGNEKHWAVYDADKTFISRPTHSVINRHNVFTALEDGYIRFSYGSNDNRHAFVEINKETDANFIGYNIDASIFYDNKVIEKETKEDFSVYLYNLMDASKIRRGYFGNSVNANYDTTDWIELPSEPLTIYDKSLKIVTARTVWYADRDFNQIYYQENTSEILAETSTFAKAKYFRYAIKAGELENTMVFPSAVVPFKFFEYGDKCLRREYISPYFSASDAKVEALKGTNGLKLSADMLTPNTILELDTFPLHLKKGIAITADMKFSTFSKVSVGKGHESYRGDWIEIDDTNVIYKHYEQSTSTVSTVAHGLTIKDSLSIALYIDNDGVCNVNITTNGGNADFSIQWKYEQNGNPFIVGGQEMTEVNLSAVALDAKCPIWLFGDSYFGVAENRVIGQLKNLGYTDGILVDGMAGIGTSSMLDDLQKLIALGGSPKIVICCEGMNDGGSGYASNINAIIGVCDGVGAELVLYKVPVVAKRITENAAVNTAMLATGKRYIDAYKAVGATDEGTWWDGYLNSDGVHPNEIGAKAIAQRILIDVPEIMQYGRKVGNVSGDISGDK